MEAQFHSASSENGKSILDYFGRDSSVRCGHTATRMAHSTHHRRYQGLLRLLRAWREAAGLTQDEIAARLGNTQSFVSKVERGERRLDVVELVEWCEALELDPQEAFGQILQIRVRGNRRKVGLRN